MPHNRENLPSAMANGEWPARPSEFVFTCPVSECGDSVSICSNAGQPRETREGAWREGMRRGRLRLRGLVEEHSLGAGQITPDLSAVVVVPSGNNGHRSRAVRWTDGRTGRNRSRARSAPSPGWFSLRASGAAAVLGNRICFSREIKEVGRLPLARGWFHEIYGFRSGV